MSTGISAFDRAHTIRTAVRADAAASDLCQPGHVFPLAADPAGVLGRDGHTETAVDLARLAGLEPAGVLVEIINDDGTMARRPQLEAFARRHGLKIGTVAELIRYRRQTESANAPDLASSHAKMADPMSASVKHAPDHAPLQAPAGARFAVVASRWNGEVVDVLVDGAREALAEAGVDGADIDVLRVPGAWDIPAVAARLAEDGRHAAIIALGCVIRGQTRHYEHVADGCAHGLMDVATRHGLPVLNGVLAVEQAEHALARAGGSAGNKGREVAQAAVEMTLLWRQAW